MNSKYLILFICFVQVLHYYYADGKSLIPDSISSLIPSNGNVIPDSISSLVPSNGNVMPDSISSLIPSKNKVIPDCFFGVETIDFILFTRKNRNGILLTIQNLTDDNVFDKSQLSCPLIFLIHGFLSSANNSNYEDMANEILNKDNVLIISIDWKKGACSNGVSLLQYAGYYKAVENTRAVGQYIANFTKILVEKYKMPMSNIRLIGHSLGAQVAGFAGKEVQKLKLGNYTLIVGLDPAGPFFNLNSCSQRICETDADYVEIMHTSLPLGTERTLGTTDFYVNNGIYQPSCNIVDISCSHTKAVIYFTECIKQECCLIGIPWDDRSQPISTCTKDKCVCIGLNVNNYPARGKFYVPVKSDYPYCNNNGTVL